MPRNRSALYRRNRRLRLKGAVVGGDCALVPRTQIAFPYVCVSTLIRGLPVANQPKIPARPGRTGARKHHHPLYNRANIVCETIDSVLEQTYKKFEIILIDDGSTDNTREVISAYDDRRIRYFYQSNGGLSAARNSGLEVSTGEFIAFLDSDDLWLKWKLSAQMEIFRRHPEAGLIWSDMSTFTRLREIDDERHLRNYYSAYGTVNFEETYRRGGTLSDLVPDATDNLARSPYYVADVFDHMFSGNLVHPSTPIVRRDRLRVAGPFGPEVPRFWASDLHFFFPF